MVWRMGPQPGGRDDHSSRNRGRAADLHGNREMAQAARRKTGGSRIRGGTLSKLGATPLDVLRLNCFDADRVRTRREDGVCRDDARLSTALVRYPTYRQVELATFSGMDGACAVGIPWGEAGVHLHLWSGWPNRRWLCTGRILLFPRAIVSPCRPKW
jgi:hypothetical protein